jgi:hypothetical protein
MRNNIHANRIPRAQASRPKRLRFLDSFRRSTYDPNAEMLQVIGRQLARGHEEQSSLYSSARIAVARAVMIPMAFATSKLIAKVGRKPPFLYAYVIVAMRTA